MRIIFLHATCGPHKVFLPEGEGRDGDGSSLSYDKMCTWRAD